MKATWRLTRGGVTLTHLHADGKSFVPELDGHFTIEAAFEPTPDFETIRPLFERELAILDDENELEEWSDIWEELMQPGLFVESLDGLDRWDIVWIHIQDGRAWWRPLFNSPKTVLRSRRKAK